MQRRSTGRSLHGAVHHADVIPIEGKSWRLREAEEAKRRPKRKKP
jgi:hypothetical protein